MLTKKRKGTFKLVQKYLNYFIAIIHDIICLINN